LGFARFTTGVTAGTEIRLEATGTLADKTKTIQLSLGAIVGTAGEADLHFRDFSPQRRKITPIF
jgi:hypothetical protein